MNNYLKSVLGIIFAVAFTNLHAQIKSGYVFGLNFSTVTLKTNGISSDPETPVGVHFGVFYEIPLKRNFALQPALLFSAKGSNYKIDTVEFSLSPIYIEVPVNAVYSFGSDVFKISLYAGPYFAVGMGGYKIISGGELKSITYGSGVTKDLKIFDAGLNFGAGINIKGLLVSAQYGIGLTNVSSVKTNVSEMKNKVIGISISSLFAGK
jgi:hypothetical protein